MFTPAELAANRTDAKADLERSGLTATLVTLQATRTETHGTAYTPGDGASWPCSVQYDSASPTDKPDGAGKRQGTASWIVFLPWDAVVKSGDKLRIDGVEHEVRSTNAQESERLTLDVSTTTKT